MYANAIRARFDTLRTIDFGDISATYAIIGTPLSAPARIIKLVNLTNENALISTNGIDDHDIIPAGSFALYDVTTNKTEQGGALFFAEGDRFYVKTATPPSEGGVSLTVIYGSTF